LAIKKIANAAGFSTAAAFGHAFKREMGTSPGMWRKSGGEKIAR
jgi:AraC-like DNA-binding protein